MKSPKKLAVIFLLTSLLVNIPQQAQAVQVVVNIPEKVLDLGAILMMGAVGTGLGYFAGKRSYAIETNSAHACCGILAPLSKGFDRLTTEVPYVLGSIGAFGCATTFVSAGIAASMQQILPKSLISGLCSIANTFPRVSGAVAFAAAGAALVAPFVATDYLYDKGYNEAKSAKLWQAHVQAVRAGTLRAELLSDGRVATYRNIEQITPKMMIMHLERCGYMDSNGNVKKEVLEHTFGTQYTHHFFPPTEPQAE